LILGTKFLTKGLFRIFLFLRINGMMPFVNVLVEL